MALLRRGKVGGPLGLRAVPFGAYLAVALWVVWLYGPLEWQ